MDSGSHDHLQDGAVVNRGDQSSSSSSSADEMFSFPGTPIISDNDDFEFGCLTPTSPSSTDQNNNKQMMISPADQFFFNGRLLPHSFRSASTAHGSSSTSSSRNSTSSISDININIIMRPATTTAMLYQTSINSSRVSSSSNNSRCSLMSSRCSSTSSSRSTITYSARTSSSDLSDTDRKAFHSKMASCRAMSARERPPPNILTNNNNKHQRHHHQLAAARSASQRWQFISPAPVLDPILTMSKNKKKKKKRTSREVVAPVGSNKSHLGIKGSSHQNTNMSPSLAGFLGRALRSFVKTCKACHAMEANVDHEDDFQTYVLVK